jgi:hypothetical protein
MFLNELEEILELLGADQLAQVSTMLFTNLARCFDSDHFQVVERALFVEQRAPCKFRLLVSSQCAVWSFRSSMVHFTRIRLVTGTPPL